MAQGELVAGEGQPGAKCGDGIRRKGMPEDEDGAGHACLTEHVALVWPHDSKTINAGGFQRGRQNGSTGTVGVGFHHGDEFGSTGGERGLQDSDIGGRGIEVDFDPGVLVGRRLSE